MSMRDYFKMDRYIRYLAQYAQNNAESVEHSIRQPHSTYTVGELAATIGIDDYICLTIGGVRGVVIQRFATMISVRGIGKDVLRFWSPDYYGNLYTQEFTYPQELAA